MAQVLGGTPGPILPGPPPGPKPPINNIPKPGNSGPAKQGPGNKGGTNTNKGPMPAIIPNAPATKPTGKPVPIPNATRHTGPYVTPPGAQLGYSNSLHTTGHPNDRGGSRAYSGLSGHAPFNPFTDNHAYQATPQHLQKYQMPSNFSQMAEGHVPMFPKVPGAGIAKNITKYWNPFPGIIGK